MTKVKRNKARFWCPQCQMVGYRNPADAQAKAAAQGKTAAECPEGFGWHYR
jgi:hypothetical protein